MSDGYEHLVTVYLGSGWKSGMHHFDCSGENSCDAPSTCSSRLFVQCLKLLYVQVPHSQIAVKTLVRPKP